jgi:hypothetical protein
MLKFLGLGFLKKYQLKELIDHTLIGNTMFAETGIPKKDLCLSNLMGDMSERIERSAGNRLGSA